LTMRSY